jgi:EF-hand domain-containing protein 1
MAETSRCIFPLLYILTLYSVSCDGFTKSYYKQKFGVDVVDVVKPPSTAQSTHSGTFAPKATTASFYDAPPKKNFNKQLENEKKILRYAASLQSEKPEDQGRKFIISYFTADDTVSIYEPPQKYASL